MPPASPDLRAADLAEFRRLIEQALDDLADLRDVMAWDSGMAGGPASFLDPLEDALHDLRQRARADDYPFGGDELPFMDIVRKTPTSLLPCKHLLLRIDETHRRGPRGADAAPP